MELLQSDAARGAGVTFGERRASVPLARPTSQRGRARAAHNSVWCLKESRRNGIKADRCSSFVHGHPIFYWILVSTNNFVSFQ